MKNLSLGMKISFGFALLIFLAFALGIMAVWNMYSVEGKSTVLAHEYVPEVDVAMELRGAANRLMFEMRGYGFTGEERFYKEAQREIASVEKEFQRARELESKSVNLKKLKGQIEIAQRAMDEYKNLIAQTVQINSKLNEFRRNLDNSASEYMTHSHEFLAGQNSKFKDDIKRDYKNNNDKRENDLLERNAKINLINDVISLGNETRIGAFKSQALRSPDVMNKALDNFDKIDKKFETLKTITRSRDDLNNIEDIRKAGNIYKSNMEEFLKNWILLQELAEKRELAGNKVIEACKVTADAGMTETDKIAKDAVSSLAAASLTMIIGLIIVFVLGILAAFFITRSITGPVNEIIAGLNEGANQVASASGQVSSSSQSMAEGSSEQAASIEETSSSMEEMASMTRKNAENASNADGLMKEANHIVKKANSSMEELTKSMEEISKASEETSKIIKTIDEIAFQTNLLALNAAVEAARAGEAGAGFAVVADEVRNLAMRAAEAAKDTSKLIEGTVKKINDGSELVTATNEAFSQVAESSGKVGTLVSEISEASKEQSNGIEQVNKAISEMDRVVQQNAANAEESAAASEEMSAQAVQLKDYMDDLVLLITGSKNEAQFEEHRVVKRVEKPLPLKSLPKPKPVQNFRNTHHGTKEIRPEQVIPLDDDEFQDF